MGTTAVPLPEEAPRRRSAGRGRLRGPEPVLVASARDGDRLAVALKLGLDRIAVPLARAARGFVRRRGWAVHGFARLDDFARESFQRSGRWLRELASLGDSLEKHPRLRRAVAGEDGGEPLGWVAATWIGRTACRDSLEAWITLARRTTVRRLRRAIRRAREASSAWPPGAEPPPEPWDLGPPARDPWPAGDALSGEADGDEQVPPAPGLAGSSAGDCRRAGAAPPEAGLLVGAAPEAPRAGGCPDEDAASSTDPDPPVTGNPEGDAARRAGGALVADLEIPAPRSLVRLPTPVPVRAAFDETAELHRAVVGHQAGVSSFVEALVAENAASGFVPDDRIAPCRPGAPRSDREAALERTTKRWEHLPPVGEIRAMHVFCRELDTLAALEKEAGRGRAAELLGQIEALIALEERLQVQLGEVLAAMGDLGAWSTLGFADVGHYAEERLRVSRSAAEKRVRLARAARKLPRLRRAYGQGFVGFEAAQLVVCAVGRERLPEEAERAWVSTAMCSTVKRLRDEASIRSRFPRPPGEGGRPPAPVPMTDAEWQASLRRRPGQTRQRIRELGRSAIDEIHADAMLRLRLPDELASDFLAAVEARRLALADLVDASAGVAADSASAAASGAMAFEEEAAFGAGAASGAAAAGPGEVPPSVAAAQLFSKTRRPIPSWVGLLSLLEDYADTWDDPAGVPRRHGDAVYTRDGFRCTAPGCTSRRNLEDHHVDYRSRGGDDELANRTCTCRFHHKQGEHGELASVRGSAPLGLEWRLGKPELGRWYRNERLLRRARGGSSRWS